MKKQDATQRILEQLGIKIEKSQWGLVGKIYDLEKQGFQVSIINPSLSCRVEEYKKIHRRCNVFFDIRHYDWEINSKYSRESILSCLEKAKIKNPKKISSSDGVIPGAWFFEEQRVCGYFLGDDIPF